MTENSGNNTKTYFGPYLTARFELLGLKDIQRQLNDERDPDESKELVELKARVAGIYESVYGMRGTFMRAYDQISRGNIDGLDLTDAQKESLQTMLGGKVGMLHRPDNVLIYASLGKNRNTIPTWTIYAMMYAVTKTHMECREAGNFIQGWLDITTGMKTEERFHEEPEAVRSLKGKGVVGHSPVIYVGDSLHDYLKRTDTLFDAKDFNASMTKRFGDRCLELLATDGQGLSYIDFEGKNFRTIPEI